MLFDLYAGIDHAEFQGTYDYPTIDEAIEDACNLAWECYHSNGRRHNLPTWEDVRDEVAAGFAGDDYDDEDVYYYYIHRIEEYLAFDAKPHTNSVEQSA